mmetsp:Transcript_6307/g.12449  ORF Transcript_6307/g.12449 Transcript_6307/m.12449 type:complete len:93 (-) Transcript_6307:3979-4257(-)
MSIKKYDTVQSSRLIGFQDEENATTFDPRLHVVALYNRTRHRSSSCPCYYIHRQQQISVLFTVIKRLIFAFHFHDESTSASCRRRRRGCVRS